MFIYLIDTIRAYERSFPLMVKREIILKKWGNVIILPITDLVSELASAIKSVICYNENYYIDTGALIELLKCESDEDIDQYLLEQGEWV